MLIEVCCGSAEDAIRSAEGQADRVELCSSLFLGGLTPSIGSLRTVKAHSEIKVMAMVRPREGGFCYNDYEFECCLRDADALLEAGADGLVFGFLTPQGEVDLKRVEKMMSIARGVDTTFHRAIDVVPNYRDAIDALVSVGVKRVLSSGLEASVFEGMENLAAMNEYAAGRLVVMPGAGITLKNIKKIAETTKCQEMHVAFYRSAEDPSVHNNRSIFYGGALYPPEDRYNVVDSKALLEARRAL